MNANYNIDLGVLRTARTNMANHRTEFENALNQMNASIENTKGVISTSADQVRQKYAEAATSQKELKDAVDAYIAYLDTVISNYEKADTGTN